jgi:peptidyl-prolyl cis-trans isomerase D
MFDFVHKHKKYITVIIGLVALTFVFWGVENRVTRGDRETVATVNGIEISVREFEDEMRRQQGQLRELLGRNFDPSVLNTPESRRQLLDSLIAQRLVASAAASSRIVVTDEMLRDTIASIPAFRGPDGSFSKATYESVLRSQSPPLTPAQFEARLRYELSLGQLTRAVAEAAIPSRTVSGRLSALEAQKREIQEARIPAQQFLAQVKVDEAKVKAYYDANPAEFRTPERVKAEYVVLSADAIAARESVSEQEVRQQWESAYGPKLREKEEARKKAQAIAAAVRKNPESFAEAAKKESQDPGSRDNGGDLGFSPRGAFVKPYEDAVFRMREGEISDVVESEFGFHIIKLTGIRRNEGKEERRSSHILIGAPGDAKPFEAMRGQIEADLKKQRAVRRFSEAADAFSNMVYEQAESLKPVAERFKLQIQTTGWITRSAQQELGALDNPKLLAALFSGDSVNSRRNTDAVEIAPGTLVSARVVDYQPEAQRKFEQVKDEIAERLRRREAAALAQLEGTAKLTQLRKGADAGVKWGAAKTVSRREAQGLDGAALRAVVSADVSKLPAFVGVALPEAGYLLVRISKVIEADPKQQGQETAARAAGLLAASQYDAYVASLRQQASISINQATLEKR